jgi:hypothetical protein
MDSPFDAQRKWNEKGELVVQMALGQPDGWTSKNYNYWGPNPEIEATYEDDDVIVSEEAKEEKETDDILNEKENDSEECNEVPF